MIGNRTKRLEVTRKTDLWVIQILEFLDTDFKMTMVHLFEKIEEKNFIKEVESI